MERKVSSFFKSQKKIYYNQLRFEIELQSFVFGVIVCVISSQKLFPVSTTPYLI